eukprot:8743783-Pyramimonas_sp.AAC.1
MSRGLGAVAKRRRNSERGALEIYCSMYETVLPGGLEKCVMCKELWLGSASAASLAPGARK